MGIGGLVSGLMASERIVDAGRTAHASKFLARYGKAVPFVDRDGARQVVYECTVCRNILNHISANVEHCLCTPSFSLVTEFVFPAVLSKRLD